MCRGMFFMIEKFSIFSIGALGYGLIEFCWRGHTHWTMLVAGGVCLMALYSLNERFLQVPLLVRCAAGACLITAVELCFGLIFNRWLHLGVWDYSGHWGNLWGQICPLYTFFWFLLCIPLLACISRAQKI